VDGIVTPSDLGKLPMRVLAFAMLTHLEAVMLTAIRISFSHEEDAVDKLGADAAAQVSGISLNCTQSSLTPPYLR
jgi:hypothetical protein